ncbi:MAG TPA: hypothetical protein VEO54_19965 [Thermoanaerobaculia bacterium]|nr:hypothetical protein [Thermoanaerobaculia bacterium]
MELMDKLFWLFFFGIVAWVAWIWIRVIVEMFRFDRGFQRPSAGRHRAAGGVGFTDMHAMPHDTVSASSESGMEIADTGSDSGGDSGGGGSGGSWS